MKICKQRFVYLQIIASNYLIEWVNICLKTNILKQIFASMRKCEQIFALRPMFSSTLICFASNWIQICGNVLERMMQINGVCKYTSASLCFFLENATGVCPIVLSPVCREDVIEYDNDCLTKCDGVEKKCKGPCPCKSTVCHYCRISLLTESAHC